MLKIIKDNDLIPVYDAENKYRNCNILLIDTEKKNNSLYGKVYAVSDSVDSHNELLDLESSLIDKGTKTILAGEYVDSLSVDHLRMVRIA